MDAQQLSFLMAFNAISRLRPVDVANLLAFFNGDAATAWQSPGEWARVASLSEAASREVLAQRAQVSPERLLGEYLNAGCSAVCWADDDYPQALRSIYDPPQLLFYRGRLPAAESLAIAVVGSRRATAYGRQVAEIFSRDLAYQGAVIVSGLARGVDSAAHQGALSAAGVTVAVLGCGLDVIYPRENEALYAEICAQGAVISEFPLGAAALAMNFPRRNRIISGLSQGVLVVEAGEKSGTLHTVNFAHEQGRDVFAVPGPVTSPLSRGTNRLIRDGAAAAALSAADVWQTYSEAPLRQPRRGKAKPVAATDPLEQRLLSLLQQPMQFDELAARPEIPLSTGDLSALLTVMEIKGQIRQLPGQFYQTVVREIRA